MMLADDLLRSVLDGFACVLHVFTEAMSSAATRERRNAQRQEKQTNDCTLELIHFSFLCWLSVGSIIRQVPIFKVVPATPE
jgi:hypothetical protein